MSSDEELPISSPSVLVTKRVHDDKLSPPYDRDASISQFRFYFKSAGLKLNKKCHFARKFCIFSGHHISAEELKPPLDRVQTLQAYPSPRNTKELC